MQILSALDATFIYLESKHSPMAIGGEMMSTLMDLSPDIRQFEADDTWEPEAIPSHWDAVAESWANAGKKVLELPGFIGKTALGAINLLNDKRLQALEPSPGVLSAPANPFNQAVE